MFTGDNKEVAAKVATEIGIKDFKYNMLPTDKYKEVENIINKNEKGRVCFIGDGINDSPVLAISDIGISMGRSRNRCCNRSIRHSYNDRQFK